MTDTTRITLVIIGLLSAALQAMVLLLLVDMRDRIARLEKFFMDKGAHPEVGRWIPQH